MFPLETIKGGGRRRRKERERRKEGRGRDWGREEKEKGERGGGRVEGGTGGGRNRRKEGEEEGGCRERFGEGGEGEGGTSGVQINCIPLWVLPGNHTQHAHAVHMLLPAPTAEPEIWCCPHRPLLSLCHKLQYGVPPNSSPVACGPSPEDSTLIWLGTSGAFGC